jgi:hypothetical protein
MRIHSRSRKNRRREGGQSLVELALMLFPLMLLSLMAIDGGGLFLAWIGINGVSREAANYAAVHPTAWGSPGNATQRTHYASIITNGATSGRCTLENPSATPVPAFPSGTTVGGPGNANFAVVDTRCRFTFITPLINQITGGGVWISSRTAIPIRAGTLSGIALGSQPPIPSFTPTPSPTPVPTPPPPTPEPSGSPQPTSSAPASPTPSPTPACDPVPNFVNTVVRGNAQSVWTAARFTGQITFSPGNISAFPSTALIGGQSLVAGAVVPCNSDITLTKN